MFKVNSSSFFDVVVEKLWRGCRRFGFETFKNWFFFFAALALLSSGTEWYPNFGDSDESGSLSDKLFGDDGGFFGFSSSSIAGDFERWRRGRAVPDLLSKCSDFDCELRYVELFLSFIVFRPSSYTQGSSSTRSGRLNDFTSISFFIRFPPFFFAFDGSILVHGSDGT